MVPGCSEASVACLRPSSWPCPAATVVRTETKTYGPSNQMLGDGRPRRSFVMETKPVLTQKALQLWKGAV